MNNISNQIFKSYDIRGIVDDELDDNCVFLIGRVLGSMALNHGDAMVVGYDGRISSPRLSQQLIAGILDAGCKVYDVGCVITPIVYFATYFLKVPSGAMITGSHNPANYNGIKMIIGGCTLCGDAITNIYDRIMKQDYISGQQGRYESVTNIKARYIDDILLKIKVNKNIHVVVDCGNGAAGNIAPELYRKMGVRVTELYCEVDGNFPNHHPDPAKISNLNDLISTVKHVNADVGFAFDGDGDRFWMVDSNGNIIYPDRQLMLFAADILSRRTGVVIYDVKCTMLLDKWIRDHGGVPVISRTGHSYIKLAIKQYDAILAGEMSGHIFFNDNWYGFDDGVYAGARLLQILSQTDIATVFDQLPNLHSTPEIHIDVKEGEQHKIVLQLQQLANDEFCDANKIITIDGVRVEYNHGFGLVRASNTTPTLILRFEADSASRLDSLQERFSSFLNKAVGLRIA